MYLEANFTPEGIQKQINEKIKRYMDAVIQRYIYIGEQFVRDARTNGDYTDRTGNLRSSIGYIVVRNGNIVSQNFSKNGDGSEGVNKGRDLAEEVAGHYSEGIVLVVVAGMEYAAAVESKGRDVLTGSSYKAEAELKRAMERLAR